MREKGRGWRRELVVQQNRGREKGRGWRRELVVQQNRGMEEGRGWRRGGDGGESW